MPSRRPPGPALAVLIAASIAAAGSAAVAQDRPPAGAERGVLGAGSSGPTVRALQRELRERGMRVAVDGRYGAGTRRAVARLQRRMGLRVNGVVDRPLLWWLGVSVCHLPGSSGPAGGGALRMGAYGSRVCGLQRALARAGERLEVDGGFGPATRAAVRRAQRRLGLRATGVADARLLGRLRVAEPERPPAAPVLLAPGSRGAAVRRLQTSLRRHGIRVAVDGAFGPATRGAVARFQRREGLPATGRVDARTQRRLAGASAATRMAAFPMLGPHWFQDDWGAARPQGRHRGTDVFGARGARIVAVADGAIERLSRVPRGRGGITIWLRADDGTAYYYAHLASIAPGLRPGSRVRAGQRIGVQGRTGDARTTPPHLHFEIHPPGRGAVNPYRQLRALSTSVV
ncbi:peptidoglycan-binding protein [Miltoncostaea marina]|uniref:peptidoglycan-binding protein n=1 Tax=Miltoncostaea marina TaxID=2843215 RepID=UPI001C3DAC62|nr:peptidoglycan-binding protein [Miltoncostaea marina]